MLKEKEIRNPAEHLLFALLDDKEGIAHQILTRLGVDSNALQRDVEEEIGNSRRFLAQLPLDRYIFRRD